MNMRHAALLYFMIIGVFLTLLSCQGKDRDNCGSTNYSLSMQAYGVTYQSFGNDLSTTQFYGGMLQFVRPDKSAFAACQVLIRFQNQSSSDLVAKLFTSRQCLQPLPDDEIYLSIFVDASKDRPHSDFSAGYMVVPVSSSALSQLATARAAIGQRYYERLRQFEYAAVHLINENISRKALEVSDHSSATDTIKQFEADFHYFGCHSSISRFTSGSGINRAYRKWADALSVAKHAHVCFSPYDLTAFDVTFTIPDYKLDYLAKHAKVFSNTSQNINPKWKSYIDQKMQSDIELLGALKSSISGRSSISLLANDTAITAEAEKFLKAWDSVTLINKTSQSTASPNKDIFLYSNSFLKNTQGNSVGYEVISLIQDSSKWARLFFKSSWGVSAAIKIDILTQQNDATAGTAPQGRKVFAESILMLGMMPIAIARSMHNHDLLKFNFAHRSIIEIEPTEKTFLATKSPSEEPGKSSHPDSSPVVTTPAAGTPPVTNPPVKSPPIATRPPQNATPTPPANPSLPHETTPSPTNSNPSPGNSRRNVTGNTGNSAQQRRIVGNLIMGLTPMLYTRSDQRRYLQDRYGKPEYEEQDPAESESIDFTIQIPSEGPDIIVSEDTLNQDLGTDRDCQ